MKVKVTRVSKRDTDKDGIKLIGKKYGKPYWKIGIQVEGSDEWYSGFANSMSDPMFNITEGGIYSITVDTKTVGDRVYKNFKLLTPEEKELEELREYKAKQEGVSTSMETSQSESHVTLDDFDSKF